MLEVQAQIEAALGGGENAERLALEARRIPMPLDKDEYSSRSDSAPGTARFAEAVLGALLGFGGE